MALQDPSASKIVKKDSHLTTRSAPGIGIENSIECRLFIVGSGRCGTTLLQSLLWAHPDVYSLPETHYFKEMDSDRLVDRIVGRCALQHDATYEEFKSFMLSEQADLQFSNSRSMRSRILDFSKSLDTVANSRGKRIWLEKTPGHLHHLDKIESSMNKVKIIHLIRSGKDTVASYWDAFRKYTSENSDWKEAQYYTLDEIASWWLRDINLSIRNLDKENHLFVRYEKLVTDTAGTLKRICNFVQLDYDMDMLEKYSDVSGVYNSPWFDSLHAPIKNQDNTKFFEIFTPAQQQHILEIVNRFDYVNYGI